ncbi:MAG: IS1634 family transposase [Actinomycetota bacterium]|nr:IS1634 family transposase [Actinomycetota bacterium]
MFLKTKRVRRANRTYEYLSLVESVRVNGTNTHRTLFRLGEAAALRESGELDRIIAALTAHAERRWIDVDELDAEQAPAIGATATIKAWWDKLELDGLFDQIGDAEQLPFRLADAVFAMVAGRLCDPGSKRRTHRWIAEQVVAPDGFSFPTLEQYYRALDVLENSKDGVERHVYSRVCDLTNLNLTLACYDLTSSYVEGDPAPNPRFPSKAFGYSRDKRGDRPQIVIGLLCSGDGIPIAHHVFAGATSDVTTLADVLADLVERFAVGRICVVADRGLISEANIVDVEHAGCHWLFATKLHGRQDVAAVLAAAADADTDAWVEVARFSSRVCDVDHDGRRYVVVFSDARQRRDTVRRLQLIAKTEARLRALEDRVRRGDLVEATEIAKAAATIVARSPVKRLFDISDVAEARFVYDYDHDALAYDELLAGHYVLVTSLDRATADAAGVLAAYRSLQLVENRFRVLKDFLGLRPIFHWTETRVRGHIAICVLAAVIETLLGNTLAGVDVRDPDLPDQHLTAPRAIDELDRIRQVTLTAGDTTIDAVTRRTRLQEQILDALDVDTRAWTKPTIH